MRGSTIDVLILGAGISGCALAYHLAHRGVGSVAVYDPSPPAAGASGRAAGVVTDQLWDRWDVEVTRDARREYAELVRRDEPEAYRPTGFVRWTADRAGVEALQAARTRLHDWGVSAEEASISTLEGWFPSGRFDDVRMALHSRDGAVVRPSSLTAIYAHAARKIGVSFDVGDPFRRVTSAERGWQVEGATRVHTAPTMVVAAGAWSKAILAGLGHPLPLTPYRTQAAVLRPPVPADPFPTAHDLDSDVYVRAEEAGRLLAGDGTERFECDPERVSTGGDPEFVAHLAESLGSRFPGWGDSEVVSAWAGVCTATPDRHPVVGEVPHAPGLYVCTGLNGFGIMRAGGIARRLADVIADSADPYAARELLGPAWAGRFTGTPLPFVPRPGFTVEPGDYPRF